MSTPLSKEDLRNARLQALAARTQVGGQAISEGGGQLSENARPAMAVASAASVETSLSDREFVEIQQCIYKGGYATNEDMLRWYNQGFQFCSSPYFGLQQGNGGPCGILAVIQAEMLSNIIFDTSSSNSRATLPDKEEVNMEKLLAQAICTVLHRAAEGGCIQLVYIPESHRSLPVQSWTVQDIKVISYGSKEAAVQAASGPEMQTVWQSGVGCMAFLLAVICSRGVQRVLADMDDPGNKLIGQFGHCNQDLINLLLTGRATSNVIDGEMELGDSGLKLRGVYQRCKIGYLSQLEAMRYCEVGSYLKIPQHPIWVVGSSSHFSVLFSLQRNVNEESRAQKLRSTLQRCFKAVDRAECGFIPASALAEALSQINLHGDFDHNPILSILQNETDLARLRGHLQIDGEIILWSAFWANISSLMSGKPLDELISILPEIANEAGSSSTALIIPEDTAMDTGAGGGSRMRSDSELARELQAELNGEVYVPSGSAGSSSGSALPSSTMRSIANSTATSTSALDFSSLLGSFNTPAASTRPPLSTLPPVTVPTSAVASSSAAVPASAPKAAAPEETRMRSDSDLARELQAQWDAEEAFGNFNDDSFPPSTTPTRLKHSLSMDVNVGKPEDLVDDLPDLVAMEDGSGPSKEPRREEGGYVAKMSAADSVTVTAVAEDFNETVEQFEMYHFNGLENATRSARLSTFTLTVRSVADAVGMSVAFQGGEHHQGGFNSPLEEVLRTRWPTCSVNWRGQPPPSID